MTQAAIADTWGYINEVLDLQSGDFHIKKLSTRKWYLQAFSILFPFLGQEWNKISSQVQSEQAALDRILLTLAQQGVIPQDYLSEIKGRNIVIADKQTIMTLIDLIKELVEQALQQAQQEGQEGQEQQDQQEAHQEQVEEQKKYEEKQHSYNKKEPKEQQAFTKNKMVVTTIKADSQPDVDRERNIHSVQGIGNEFQDEQLQGSGTDQAEKQGHQPLKGYNIFPQSHSNSNKPLKVTNYKNDEEDEQENYLNQKLIKCKSQQKLKNLPVSKGRTKKEKKVRALVAHPPIKKEYSKAVTPAQKKLSSTVKNVISGSRKFFDKQNIGMKSPTGKDHLDRKKRELNYFTSASKAKNPKRQQAKDKSMAKLKKLLKWKEANLKRQQRQLQQDVQMKVQLKKQTYVKKINKLILKLQKQKMLDRKKEERQRQRQQRQVAQKRLQAIQQQYRDQMSLLHSKSPQSKKGVAHLDHKAIIQSLQRDLKKQNEKQINLLKMKMRREEAQLDDDLQILQNEIVKAYKRN